MGLRLRGIMAMCRLCAGPCRGIYRLLGASRFRVGLDAPRFNGLTGRVGVELPPRAEKASRFALMAAGALRDNGLAGRVGTELPPRAEKASRFALMAASVAVLRGILGDRLLAMGRGSCRIRLRGVIGLTLSLWGIIYSSI